MKRFKRATRVSSLVRQILAELLSSSAQDPRVKHAVITKVSLGDDLRLATIGFQVVDGDPQEVLNGLNKAKGFLRRELGKRLQMRTTPDLRFTYDDSLDATARIDEILNRIKVS